MVGRIAIGEVHDRANHHGQHMGHEALVVLIHDGARRLAFVERAARRAIEIDDAAAQVGRVARSRAARTGDVRTNLGWAGEASNVEAASNATSRRQPDRAQPPARDTQGDGAHRGHERNQTPATRRRQPLVYGSLRTGRSTHLAQVSWVHEPLPSEPVHQLGGDERVALHAPTLPAIALPRSLQHERCASSSTRIRPRTAR